MTQIYAMVEPSDGYDFITDMGRIHFPRLPDDVQAAVDEAVARLQVARDEEVALASKVDLDSPLQMLQIARDRMTRTQRDALDAFETSIKDADWRR